MFNKNLINRDNKDKVPFLCGAICLKRLACVHIIGVMGSLRIKLIKNKNFKVKRRPILSTQIKLFTFTGTIIGV